MRLSARRGNIVVTKGKNRRAVLFAGDIFAEVVHPVDDFFHDACSLPGMSFNFRVTSNASRYQYYHRNPGSNNGIGHRHRSDVEYRGSREFHRRRRDGFLAESAVDNADNRGRNYHYQQNDESELKEWHNRKGRIRFFCPVFVLPLFNILVFLVIVVFFASSINGFIML